MFTYKFELGYGNDVIIAIYSFLIIIRPSTVKNDKGKEWDQDSMLEVPLTLEWWSKQTHQLVVFGQGSKFVRVQSPKDERVRVRFMFEKNDV